jgi:hypothetical protein
LKFGRSGQDPVLQSTSVKSNSVGCSAPESYLSVQFRTPEFCDSSHACIAGDLIASDFGCQVAHRLSAAIFGSGSAGVSTLDLLDPSVCLPESRVRRIRFGVVHFSVDLAEGSLSLGWWVN